MTKKLLAKVGTYTNAQNEQKNDYVKVGVIMSGDNGEYLLLDPTVNLAGVLAKQNLSAAKESKPQRDSIMVSVFDSEQQNQQTGGFQQQGGFQNQQQGGFQNQQQPQQAQQGGFQRQPQAVTQNAQAQQNNGGGFQQQQRQAPASQPDPAIDFDDDIPF